MDYKVSLTFSGFCADSRHDEILVGLFTHVFTGKSPYETIHLDTWSSRSGFQQSTDLYPNKLTDLQGKNLPIVTIHYPPLAVIDWDKDPSTYDGMELQLIYEWARKLNFTWSFLRDDALWGEIWGNGSGNGISGLVYMDQAMVGFSGFYLWEDIFRYVDYRSVTIHRIKT